MVLLGTKIRKQWLVFAMLISGLVCALAAINILFFEISYRDRFYPGVHIGEKNIGNMTYAQAFHYVKNKANDLTENGINLRIKKRGDSREIKIPTSIPGLTSDSFIEYFSLGKWEQDLQHAYDFGRAGSLIQRIKDQLSLIVTAKKFDLRATLHKEAIQSLLSRELNDFLADPSPAQFVFAKGKMHISPEKNGDGLNIPEIMAIIGRKLAAFDSAPIGIASQLQAPLSTQTSLKPFLALAEELADSVNVSFYYENNSWIVSGRRLATWLTTDQHRKIVIYSKKIRIFLAQTVAPLIDHPPQNSRFELRNHKLVEILSGKPGNVVDIRKTAEKVDNLISKIQRSSVLTGDLLLALTSPRVHLTDEANSSTIDIPIEIMQAQPGITKQVVDEYGIKDLVGAAKTNFKGSSEDRVHNINRGVAKLNGLLIAPNQEFSAIAAIGTTSEEEGFVKEFVIKEDKTIKELGGGLCQIATTLFRLGLNAGLPITERMNHRYLVSYYGPGLDATIYDPAPDLKFINNTGNYLLLQGKVINNNEVSFEFYGQKDGRSVQISEPVLSDEIPPPGIKLVPSEDLPFGQMECSETPRKGLTADVTYTVRYPSGETKEQKFRSIYQPWQKICLYGYKK